MAAIEQDEHSTGKDLISLLLKANKDASPKNRLSDLEVIGQFKTFMVSTTIMSSGNGL